RGARSPLAVAASASPKTCGCRRTSFSWTARVTSSRSPAPCSSRSNERKNTWKRRSPSASRRLAGSSANAASATSYASSTVCGTIVRSVCSRSQGHSRRRCRVRAWRSRTASARLTRESLSRRPLLGGVSRSVGHSRRLVARGVADLAVVGRLLVLDPLLDLVVALLLQEECLDLGLDLLQRLQRRLLRVLDRLDDVVSELRLHGLRDFVRREREGGLLELGHRSLPLDDRVLPTVGDAARVGRVLLDERGKIGTGLQLGIHVIGLRLARGEVDVAVLVLDLQEDVPDIARTRRAVLGRVRGVALEHLLRRDLRVLRHGPEDLRREHGETPRRRPVLLRRVAGILQRLFVFRAVAVEPGLDQLVLELADIRVGHFDPEIVGRLLKLHELHEIGEIPALNA